MTRVSLLKIESRSSNGFYRKLIVIVTFRTQKQIDRRKKPRREILLCEGFLAFVDLSHDSTY